MLNSTLSSRESSGSTAIASDYFLLCSRLVSLFLNIGQGPIGLASTWSCVVIDTRLEADDDDFR